MLLNATHLIQILLHYAKEVAPSLGGGSPLAHVSREGAAATP